MIKLDAGNVLLKPSHRRQLMTALRRCLRIGERLGNFILNISMRRTGRQLEIKATVHDRAGDFACRSRQVDWRGAVRDLSRQLMALLHQQYLGRQVQVA